MQTCTRHLRPLSSEGSFSCQHLLRHGTSVYTISSDRLVSMSHSGIWNWIVRNTLDRRPISSKIAVGLVDFFPALAQSGKYNFSHKIHVFYPVNLKKKPIYTVHLDLILFPYSFISFTPLSHDLKLCAISLMTTSVYTIKYISVKSPFQQEISGTDGCSPKIANFKEQICIRKNMRLRGYKKFN